MNRNQVVSTQDVVESCGISERGACAMMEVLASVSLVSKVRLVGNDEQEDNKGPTCTPVFRYVITDSAERFMCESSPFHWLGVLFSTVKNTAHERLKKNICTSSTAPSLQPKPALPSKREAKTASDGWFEGHLTCFEQAWGTTMMMHRLGQGPADKLAEHLRTIGIFDIDTAGGRQPRESVRILDMGGGSGVYSTKIAQALPHVHATVGDLKLVCDAVRKGKFTPEQVDLVSIDMLRDDWPGGYGVHLLSNILHDWAGSRQTILTLLKKSFDALPTTGGYLLVHEMFIGSWDEQESLPKFVEKISAACYGMHMVMFTKQGRQVSNMHIGVWHAC